MSTHDPTFRNASIAAAVAGTLASLLAVVGWNLFEFDRALVLYAVALIASLTLTVYRMAIWMHRPPTMLVYRQAVRMLRRSDNRVALVRHLLTRVFGYFALNRFVWQRGLQRWLAHWPIMVGCLMALAIVVPLIFGWVWFETPADDLHTYQVMLFGQHVRTIPVDGIEAFLAFHGLVWASFPVVVGCSVALARRLRDRGDQATQTVGGDLMPLVLLLSIASTGLLMTISYSFLGGWWHAPIATIHMLVVCGTLLWLPYSKLFHIPQRSLKLAHMVYEHESKQGTRATCIRCEQVFADLQQIKDLIDVQQQLGYRYELDRHHYQQICPRCRRAMLVIAQGSRWKGQASSTSLEEVVHGV